MCFVFFFETKSNKQTNKKGLQRNSKLQFKEAYTGLTNHTSLLFKIFLSRRNFEEKRI